MPRGLANAFQDELYKLMQTLGGMRVSIGADPALIDSIQQLVEQYLADQASSGADQAAAIQSAQMAPAEMGAPPTPSPVPPMGQDRGPAPNPDLPGMAGEIASLQRMMAGS